MTVEHGFTPGPRTPVKMPEGIAFSAVVHIGILALVLIGLPQLFRSPPPLERTTWMPVSGPCGPGWSWEPTRA